ncbi:hypothetical protein ACIBO2_31705 [Nonomuraea sp. NPDC050022]
MSTTYVPNATALLGLPALAERAAWSGLLTMAQTPGSLWLRGS